MGLGTLAFAQRDKETGSTVYVELETVHPTLPPRVYRQTHVDYVVDAVRDLYATGEDMRRTRLVYEAPYIRHFTARLEPL